MDLNELYEKKEAMDNTILKAINKFEQETSLEVECILLHRVEQVGSRYGVLYKAESTVPL